MKRQPTEWKKIFANDMTYKGLIFKIYNSSYNSTSKKQTTWLKYEQEKWIDIFPKRKWRCQQAHEKMLDIANHQGNANQNHSEVSPQTCQNGYNQKEPK